MRAALALALLVIAAPAAAQTQRPASLFMSEPFVDRSSDEVLFGIGVLRSGPGRAALERLRVELDGEIVTPRTERLLAAEGDAGKGWRPTMSVTLVYYWGEGAPPEILDGIPLLFKRLPSVTPVYPVPYGEGWPTFVTPRTASNLAGGDLDTLARIAGPRPTLADSVRFAASEAQKDQSALRFLIIVTDGRDHQLGFDHAAFFKLGTQLHASQFIVQVVAYPAPGDVLRNANNAENIAIAAGGKFIPARTAAELASAIEAASLAFLDMQIVAVQPGPRLFGARVPLKVTALVDGVATAVTATVPIEGSSLIWLALAGLALTLSIGAGLLWKVRAGGRAVEIDALLVELQRLIRLGTPAERIVVELSRRFPRDVRRLNHLDPGQLERGQFEHLRTRAARAVLQEIQRAMTAQDEGHEGEADLVSLLAGAVTAGVSASEAATRLRARLPDRVWGAFARSSFREVARLLRQSATTHPSLATPQARQLVLAIQDALCKDKVDAASVAWLVRAGGPGRRGETLRLHPRRTIIGRARSCQVVLDDPAVAPEHVSIVEEEGVFSVSPGEAPVKVEGEPVAGPRRLADGDTLEIGGGAYVFKSAVAV